MAEGFQFLSLLRNLVFPPRCAGCNELLDFTDLHRGSALCSTCEPQWNAEKEEVCGHCFCKLTECSCMTEIQERTKSKGFYKLVYYRNGTRNCVPNRVIYQIKNKREARTPTFLARELYNGLRYHAKEDEISLDHAVLTFVPRRRSSYLKYGTDQAYELARALSLQSGIPLVKCLNRKKGRQREQKTLNPQERMKNARASFAIQNSEAIRGKTVFLIDDIVTTGASMAVCTRLLLRAGADAVYCVAVASDEINRMPQMAPLIKLETR